MATTLIHLVRHGESVANVLPGTRRSDDPPLTERGRDQARRAATALAALGVDAVLGSRLRRARETAAAIAAACGLSAEVVDGFAEVDMGTLSDPDTEDGRREREAIFSAWLAGDFGRGFPGGERFDDVVARVRAALLALARQHPGRRIALVTHRMPIAAAVAVCAAASGTSPVPGACPNGSITTLRSDGQGCSLVRWADATHLEPTAPAGRSPS